MHDYSGKKNSSIVKFNKYAINAEISCREINRVCNELKVTAHYFMCFKSVRI